MKYAELRTPAYIVDEAAIRRNVEILKQVEDHTGCSILLAQKAFSMYRVYPLIARYLSGTTASGIFEARLAAEEFHTEDTAENTGSGHRSVSRSTREKETPPEKENHVFEPAYKPEEMQELCRICTHIYFNSLACINQFL